MQGPEKGHVRGYRLEPNQDSVYGGGSPPPGPLVLAGSPGEGSTCIPEDMDGCGCSEKWHKRCICVSPGAHAGDREFPAIYISFP